MVSLQHILYFVCADSKINLKTVWLRGVHEGTTGLGSPSTSMTLGGSWMGFLEWEGPSSDFIGLEEEEKKSGCSAVVCLVWCDASSWLFLNTWAAGSRRLRSRANIHQLSRAGRQQQQQCSGGKVAPNTARLSDCSPGARGGRAVSVSHGFP